MYVNGQSFHSLAESYKEVINFTKPSKKTKTKTMSSDVNQRMNNGDDVAEAAIGAIAGALGGKAALKAGLKAAGTAAATTVGTNVGTKIGNKISESAWRKVSQSEAETIGTKFESMLQHFTEEQIIEMVYKHSRNVGVGLEYGDVAEMFYDWCDYYVQIQEANCSGYQQGGEVKAPKQSRVYKDRKFEDKMETLPAGAKRAALKATRNIAERVSEEMCDCEGKKALKKRLNKTGKAVRAAMASEKEKENEVDVMPEETPADVFAEMFYPIQATLMESEVELIAIELDKLIGESTEFGYGFDMTLDFVKYVNEEAGDAFARMSDDSFRKYLQSLGSPEAKQKAQQKRREAQSRRGSSGGGSGLIKKPTSSSSSSGSGFKGAAWNAAKSAAKAGAKAALNSYTNKQRSNSGSAGNPSTASQRQRQASGSAGNPSTASQRQRQASGSAGNPNNGRYRQTRPHAANRAAGPADYARRAAASATGQFARRAKQTRDNLSAKNVGKGFADSIYDAPGKALKDFGKDYKKPEAAKPYKPTTPLKGGRYKASSISNY